MNTNTDDLQAGFAHAAEISAKRDSAIGKPLTEDEKIIAACAFAKGADHARAQDANALALLDRIVNVADLLLATGNKSMPIDMSPPPSWLSDARELLAKREGGAE